MKKTTRPRDRNLSSVSTVCTTTSDYEQVQRAADLNCVEDGHVYDAVQNKVGLYYKPTFLYLN